jgi:hypothetical protein
LNFSGIVGGHVFDHAQHALGAAFADGLDGAAFLQQLARDVERQVGRIHHALDEAQVGGHQRLGVVHDEDALDVELHARGLVAVEHVHGRLGRDEEQLRVLGRAFHAVVRGGQRRFAVVADLAVELVVLVLRDVFFGARPQGRRLVDGLPLAGGHHLAGLVVFALFPLLFGHQDGQRDVVGVFVDDALELPGIEVVERIFLEVQDDAGAALGALNLADLEFAGAVAAPAHALAGRQARAAAFHRDLVGHDKARIKTHAELAYQLRVVFLVARELGHEVARAALGDGAQVVDGFLLRQAYAVVGDGQRAGGLVEAHAHLEFGVVFIAATRR